jgi:two-component system NarL family response regulator
MIKVLLTDDHHLFREGLARILRDAPGIKLVATANSGEEAQKLAAQYQPDIILMDINMPGIGGIEATRQLHQMSPEIKVLMLTVSEEDQDLFTAVRAGARGYILKNTSSRELLESIHLVHNGEAVINPSMAVKLLDEFASLSSSAPRRKREPTPQSESLTDREREVLKHVARGLSNKEIGDHLSISPHTVKAHLRSILDKLHLRGRVDAAAWAVRHGMLRED